MYEWRAKARMIFAHGQDDHNMRVLRMLEGTFSLEVAQFTNNNNYIKVTKVITIVEEKRKACKWCMRDTNTCKHDVFPHFYKGDTLTCYLNSCAVGPSWKGVYSKKKELAL